MEPPVLQEQSISVISIGKYVENPILWNEQMVSIVNDKGTVLLKFNNNIACFDKKIDVTEVFIECPKFSAARVLLAGTQKFVKSNLDKNQLLVDPALWPHSPNLVKERCAVTSYCWSPPGFMYNLESLLAINTNIGQVVLFGQATKKKWIPVSNISEVIAQEHSFDSLRNFDSMYSAVKTLGTCSICWGDAPAGTGSCYFVTAQMNGDIIFWSIQVVGNEVKATILTTHHTETQGISSIFWISKTNNSFLLIYSNALGELQALDCEIVTDKFTITTHYLWKYQDKMIVRHLKHLKFNDKILLLFAKHRHLIALMVNETCSEIEAKAILNINDEKITSIQQDQGDFYVSVANFRIYKVLINFIDKELEMITNSIQFKEQLQSEYELYNFCLSDNGVIWILAIQDKKLDLRKERICVNVGFFSLCESNKEIELLLQNPTKNLNRLYDCIELVRVKCCKSHTMPAIDYTTLFEEAKTDLYKTKLYYLFLRIYQSIKLRSLAAGQECPFPETSLEKVRDLLLFLYAQNLLDDKIRSGILSDLDKESLVFIKDYLECYCKKYELNLSDYVDVNSFNIFDTYDFNIKCQCCDQSYDGQWYNGKHFNMMCCVTLTPINNSEYLCCSSCGATARIELMSYNPLCTFCDLKLVKC